MGAEFDEKRAEKAFQDVLRVMKENGVDLPEVKERVSLFLGSQVEKRAELKSLIFAACWIQDCMDF